MIDLRPESGDKGGEIVAEGTPKEVANTRSHTGQYLQQVLKQYPPIKAEEIPNTN